jgi:hypothetical protein
MVERACGLDVHQATVVACSAPWVFSAVIGKGSEIRPGARRLLSQTPLRFDEESRGFEPARLRFDMERLGARRTEHGGKRLLLGKERRTHCYLVATLRQRAPVRCLREVMR